MIKDFHVVMQTYFFYFFFFFQAEDGIRDRLVTGVQTCALPIYAIDKMQARKIEFSGQIVGAPNTDLRQIFTQPENKNGKAYTVLELIERHNGYQGFLPPQADGLMESSRL